jgi:hypothetical protein
MAHISISGLGEGELRHRLAEVEAEKVVIDQDNAKLQQVLETERGVLREVMATARKAVGEMNRQNEILKKRVAELEANQGSSVSVTVNHDEIFQKDLEIQRLQIKVHEMELELRKAKRGGDGPAAEDYSGAGILVTRIQRECGLRMLNSQLKSTNRKRAAVGFGIWCVVTKGQLMSCPRGNSSGGSLIETIPCEVTTKWSVNGHPNFDHGSGTVDAHRTVGLTSFKISSSTCEVPSMAEKVSVLFEIAEAAKPVARKQMMTNKSPPRSRHRQVDVNQPRSPRGRTNPNYRKIEMPRARHEYSTEQAYSPREQNGSNDHGAKLGHHIGAHHSDAHGQHPGSKGYQAGHH